MPGFLKLLRDNHNYRSTWTGQVVSEVGDHFNNIAVFSLALENTRSGMVVTFIMLSRAIPAILAGPLAGVALDRFDRKRIMIASDLVRAAARESACCSARRMRIGSANASLSGITSEPWRFVMWCTAGRT